MILFALKLQVARKLVLWQAFSFDHSLIVEKVSSRESFTFKNVIHLIKLMTKSAFILKLDGLALLVTDPPNANFTSRISSPICDPPFIIHKAWYQLCNFKSFTKKNAYGRQRISRPMRKVGPIQFWRGCVIFLFFFFFIFLRLSY